MKVESSKTVMATVPGPMYPTSGRLNSATLNWMSAAVTGTPSCHRTSVFR